MKLTVQQLIEKLNKIEDKEEIVHIYWHGSVCDCTDITFVGMHKIGKYKPVAKIIYH